MDDRKNYKTTNNKTTINIAAAVAQWVQQAEGWVFESSRDRSKW